MIICLGIFIFHSTHTVHTLLSFLAVVLLTAVILILLGSELFAILYVLIYIGVILVFFMFTLMLVNMRFEAKKIYSSDWAYYFTGFSHFWLMSVLAEVGYDHIYHLEDLLQVKESELNEPWIDSLVALFDIENIGFTLYSQYGIFVFILGLILLSALIGSLKMIDILKQHEKYRLAAAEIEETLQPDKLDEKKHPQDIDWFMF